MFKASILICDNSDWKRYKQNGFPLKYYVFFNTIKIQLWHGIGYKKIELSNPKNPKVRRIKLVSILFGFFPYYDYLVSTSKYFSENLYKYSFFHKKILELGYPRNDIFLKKKSQPWIIFKLIKI